MSLFWTSPTVSTWKRLSPWPWLLVFHREHGEGREVRPELLIKASKLPLSLVLISQEGVMIKPRLKTDKQVHQALNLLHGPLGQPAHWGTCSDIGLINPLLDGRRGKNEGKCKSSFCCILRSLIDEYRISKYRIGNSIPCPSLAFVASHFENSDSTTFWV